MMSTSIETLESFENKYLNIIESLFMFCVIWIISNFIQESSKAEAHSIIIDQIKIYRKTLEFKFQNPFGKNFFDFFENKPEFYGISVFDIIYDLRSEKWILLNEIDFLIGQSINNKFETSTLSHNEIIRLNPDAIKLDYIQKQLKNEQEFIMVLNSNSIFIDTPRKILAKYILELLIEYEKNFIIYGENYSGKSSLLQDLYKCKLERNQMNAIFLPVNTLTTISQVYKFFYFVFS